MPLLEQPPGHRVGEEEEEEEGEKEDEEEEDDDEGRELSGCRGWRRWER